VNLKQLIADIEPIGHIKEIHSDNSREYISQAFQMVLWGNSIKHAMMALYSPYQNDK